MSIYIDKNCQLICDRCPGNLIVYLLNTHKTKGTGSGRAKIKLQNVFYHGKISSQYIKNAGRIEWQKPQTTNAFQVVLCTLTPSWRILNWKSPFLNVPEQENHTGDGAVLTKLTTCKRHIDLIQYYTFNQQLEL